MEKKIEKRHEHSKNAKTEMKHSTNHRHATENAKEAETKDKTAEHRKSK